MKRHVLLLLAALNLALAALLAWLWLTPQGELRNVRWLPPEPVRPVLADAAPLPAFEIDANRYVATLERPLFAPTRRPPPPPLQAASAPAAEVLPDIRLLGVYGNKDAGGVVASVDGKVRRLRIGEAIGGWSVKGVRGGELVVARGDETRSFELKRSTGAEPPAASAGSSAAGAGTAAVPATGGTPTAGQTAHQKDVERAREQVRRVNVARARKGMRLLPEP
jgi:hypothetical protein